jgi:hypothetical protein
VLRTKPAPEPPDAVVAEIEAIGDADPAEFMNANFELVVAVPPTSKSTVELPGNKVPDAEFKFQYPTVPAVAHIVPAVHTVPLDEGKVKVVPFVPEKVRPLLKTTVCPSAILSVVVVEKGKSDVFVTVKPFTRSALNA